MRSELAILDDGGIKIKRSTRARNFILCVCTKIGKKVIFWYNSLISMHYIRDALGTPPFRQGFFGKMILC